MSTPVYTDLPDNRKDRIVRLCSDAIRIDTSPSGGGVRAASGFVAAEPTRMEFAPRLLEPPRQPIGTDGKYFDRLGISNSNWVPLPLPAGYDFASVFHGVEERVPVFSPTAGSVDPAGLLWRMLMSPGAASPCSCLWRPRG